RYGQPLTGEFLVNQTTAGIQVYPAIVSLTDNSYVIAWVSSDINSNHTSIRFRRYSSSDLPMTAELDFFGVSANAANVVPAITRVGDGYAIGASRLINAAGTPTSVYARVYDSNNVAGSLITVHNVTTGDSQ